MVENLDKTDRRLLRLLQRDSTLSMDALAEQVHLSRNACWRRIRNLENSGVVKGRVTLLEASAVGLDLSAFVMVRTNRHDEEWLVTFNRAVSDMPEIVGAHRMAGDVDYLLRVRLANMREYDDFYQRLIARVPISDVSASFVMEDIKDTTELPI